MHGRAVAYFSKEYSLFKCAREDWFKIKRLLGSVDQKRLMWLLLPMTITAMISAFGIAFVMPFLAVVAAPKIVFTNAHLSAAYHFFGFTQVVHFVIFLGFLALALLVLTDAMAAFTTWLSANIVAKVRARMTQRLFEIYLDKRYEFHINHNSATLVNNLFQLASNFTNGFILQGMTLLTNLISIVAILGLIIAVNPMMALMTSVMLGGVYLLVYLLVKRTLANGGDLIVKSSEASMKLANESFGGIKDIKLKGSEQVFKRLLLPKLEGMYHFQALQQVMLAMPRYALEVVAFGGVIVLVLAMLLSGWHVGKIIPMLALYVYSGYRLMPAIQQLFSGVANLKISKASLDKVYSSFSEGDIPQAGNQSQLMEIPDLPFTRVFEMRGVTYSYDSHERVVIEQMNMTVKHNQMVGVIGPTGAGKTTLIDIILGLLKPSSGQMLVDGVVLDSKEKVAAWQRSLGYVPQHIFLADSSIRENIAFGEDVDTIDDAKIIQAAKVAALHDFIVTELADGYDTMVGERGVRLSGGQMQRVGIARALYRQPQVLVLDEATSSLDHQTEAGVMQAIYNMRNSITIIIIAHRLTTVRGCDQIFLIDSGKLKDQGTFAELVGRHEYLGAPLVREETAVI